MSNQTRSKHLYSTSHETLSQLLDTLSDAFIIIDDSGTIIYTNTSACMMVGTTPESLIGTSFWYSASHLMSPTLYQAVYAMKQSQKPTEVEYIVPVTQTRLHVQLSPIAEGLVLQFHEVREPDQPPQTVPKLEHLSFDDLNGLHTRIGILTPEGIVLDINNDASFDEPHFQREKVIGWPLADIYWWAFYPTSQRQLRAAITRASQGETVRFETLIHPRKGLDLYIEVIIMPHWDMHQHVDYLIYAGTDITARKRTDEAIHTLLDALPQLVWLTHPDGSVIYNNQRLINYLALTLEQVQENGWMAFVHPEDLQRVREVWQTALQTGMPFEIEYRMQDGNNGVYHWFLVRGVPQQNEQGAILHWVGTCTNIDEQKRIEEALRQSQECVSALMNSCIIGIVITEGELVVDANGTALRMTGYSREDLHARRIDWMQMTPPEYHTRTVQAQQELAAQHAIVPYEKEVICKDGSRLPVIVGQVALRTHPSRTIGFILDNSARKELDQRKDEFINMASHELRNPLMALKMRVQLTRRRQQKQSHNEVVTALSTLEEPIKQLERLIEELLDVSKIQAGKLEYRKERVDLHALLREVTDTLQYSYPSHRIVVGAPARACLIGDRDRLGQVLTNLISNAIKYSPQAQTVEVKMDTTEDGITVRVRDHGLGIPREQCEKIFERFYRVATPQQKGITGLGMGLYIVARIVKDHEGIITVESEVGKGSTFTVTLPHRRCA
ncbi:hypothetical protein KDA_48790 [Dictyobacter alpinus]|uniref:histidine kinase n=1 Tax=Dictyobacter alpinus TaxID=2014873 RepID=A0A402BDF7_9CHLR|nr:PAS domain S-box protein [Dictyobacter alpinus]GCE29395.1 hypothetical protein KDA_48790 [Dictyobacter alpinus]